jgi:biopolymer transport protein ExbB
VTPVDLFLQSLDVFTVLLVLGSVAAVTVLVRCVIEVRESRVLPASSAATIRSLAAEGRTDELRGFVRRDDFVCRVVEAALRSPSGDPASARDAAELAASEQCARLFRKIEPLNILGTIGPLLGLAGTVWGMIKAFSALGVAGGQANPSVLSEGISKALFHTLLGLMLALPALAAFGLLRSRVDRICNRAMALAAELVDMLPAAGAGSAAGAARPAPTQPAPVPANSNAAAGRA